MCVTGTNGKSTTTHLAGALLAAAGREVEVCGNIGRAICEVAKDVSPRGLLVAEVSSFKLLKRRVFRMSPLHHHFELSGWAESRVVLRFYIAGALLALLSLSTFKLQ